MEDSLREMFADRVRRAPTLDDPATTAIRRSRRRRFGQQTGATLASVLALVVLAGGVVSVRDWFQEPASTGVTSQMLPPPDPVPQDVEPWRGEGMGLEIRLVNRMWTADGQRLLLSGAALVEQAYRTPHGVLYGNEEQIRLLTDDGAAVDIASGVGDWLVAPDAHRLAWSSAGIARTASLDAAGLGLPSQVRVPRGTAPAVFWGDRVVLAGPEGHGYAVWDPAGGQELTWTDDVVAVYGQAKDDLVVLVGEPGAYCVTVVPADAADLQPASDGDCAQPLPEAAEADGWLAPDGRWLAVPADDEVLLLDVVRQPDGDSPLVACPRRQQPEPVWWDATTLVTADGTGAISCAVNGRTERLGLPDELGSRWEYVPVRG